MRFVLGIVSGCVLGYIGKDLLDGIRIGSLALSIVGGFTSDGAEAILRRLADAIVASTKGLEQPLQKKNSRRY
jgi:hypothetical protein